MNLHFYGQFQDLENAQVQFGEVETVGFSGVGKRSGEHLFDHSFVWNFCRKGQIEDRF